MSQLSLCMIVKNEAEILEKNLGSVAKLVDEIIIVDTGSTDKTKEIASKFTSKVFDFKWIDDFSAARNFAQEKATNQYILMWDADWFISPENLKKALNLKQKRFQNFDKIAFTWVNYFDLEGKARAVSPRGCIFKKDKFYWKYPIFEQITPLKNQTFTQKYFSEIEILHQKNLLDSNPRNSQNFQILNKALKQFPEDLILKQQAVLENYRLENYREAINYFLEITKNPSFEKALDYLRFYDILVSAIDSCIKIDNFDLAKSFIQSFKNRYPGFLELILLEADMQVLEDIPSAQKIYLEVISKVATAGKKQNLYYKNYEKVNVYPYQILAEISLINKDKILAKKYLEIATKNTSLQTTKNTITLSLNSLN